MGQICTCKLILCLQLWVKVSRKITAVVLQHNLFYSIGSRVAHSNFGDVKSEKFLRLRLVAWNAESRVTRRLEKKVAQCINKSCPKIRLLEKWNSLTPLKIARKWHFGLKMLPQALKSRPSSALNRLIWSHWPKAEFESYVTRRL